LNQAGLFEDRHVAIEYHSAEDRYDLMPALAAELVRRQVAVIVAVGGVPPGLAAKAATSTIPVVFIIGGDPVKLGLVASLNRPGGNVTGVTILSGALTAKRLELLHELVPGASVVAFLVNPASPEAETQLTDARAAARTIGQDILVMNAGGEHDLEAVFASRHPPQAAGRPGGSLFDSGDSLSARVCGGRRTDELRKQPRRCVSPGWQPDRQDLERG
jgi:putative ABC transport system substrate-binding protein